MDKLKEIKEEVIKAGKEICESGLIARTWGNVSSRVDGEHFAITASGKGYMTLTEEEVIVVDLEQLNYEGDIKPSGERKVHREIYKLKPEANFVIHTHQTYASALAAMGLNEIKLGEPNALLGDSIPCAGYGLPGTKTVSDNVASAVKSSECKAILMRNHGAVCYGKDYEEAFAVAKELEVVSKVYIEDKLGVRNIEEDINSIYNDSNKGKKMRAYLDDFAQMFGSSLNMSNYSDESMAREIGEDTEAVSMVVAKNKLAAVMAKLAKAKPINSLECKLMRIIYKQKYSKLKDK